jgi:group II intron reverse transcriptase/maturase
MKPPKETRRVEGRDQLEGIPRESAKGRTRSRVTLPSNLARVNEAARRDRRTRFTSLLHHVSVESLERAFRRMKRRAAPGVDGETVASYEEGLANKLADLCARVHTGRYRPLPVRRVNIPKPNGGTRPLGVPALEDKILQSAVAEILSAIYEVDFLGLSYGFRPGHNPHDALSALHTAVMSQHVNWVIDADIRSFFDSVDHEWLMRMIEHRIADRRVLALIRKWLKAGVLDGGVWKETDSGTPQGSGISPILANIFLHYVLDLWFQQWRRGAARGRVIMVRYCDDFVMGFQDRVDAEEMLTDLKERLEKFNLQLHEGKTRLIEFGRLPSLRREQRGEQRCETFAFLGFTHYCARTRDGRFVLKRKTESRRLSRKLKAVRQELHWQMHSPTAVQHRWLLSVLRGHYAYYGLPSNHRAMNAFRRALMFAWFGVLHRRSQRSLGWPRYLQILDQYPLPGPTITRPRVTSSLGLPS